MVEDQRGLPKMPWSGKLTPPAAPLASSAVVGNFSMDPKVIVVLSGGQDSVTCLYWALKKWAGERIHCITFSYGQTHEAAEIRAVEKVVSLARLHGVVSYEIIAVPNCLISSSPLQGIGELERYKNAEQMNKVIGNRREQTFVPMRNALFLTIAANRAEAMKCVNIVTGVCQMDGANYDDCRQVFITATEDYINKALGNDHRMGGLNSIRIWTPLMKLTKAQTVKLAAELPGCWDALAYSHTSYAGEYPPTHKNHANVLRASGFEKAGHPDPLVLRAHFEGLMELPDTSNYDLYR